jgi:molecular chaperone DnaK (HSP70)
MLKTVTLDNEEMELLLSHHKQKLEAVTKEIQMLKAKQHLSETRIDELGELSQAYDDEAFSEAHSHETESMHQKSGAFSEEHLHEPESLSHEDNEPSFEEHLHETEETHHENNEEPVEMHLHETEPMHHEDNEGPSF